MSFIVKDKQGKDFDPVPAGMHHAICYAVIDIGTQPQKGQYPTRRKVMFSWELPNERIEVKRSDTVSEDLPRVISARYTLSLASKGLLRPMLESWRGRSFTQAELEGFDLGAVIGANCFLNVVHELSADKSKTYANVASVNPLAKGMEKKKPENPTTLFFMDDFKVDEPITFPEGMHEWIQKLIMQSEEFQNHGKPVASADPANPSGEAFPLDESNPELLDANCPF